MKKIIPFSKDIKFNTKIYEITSISLEHNLSISENNMINGEFIISGDYKMNDSSVNTEPFIHGLPFDITLDTKYDMDRIKIDIDDFKFEIVNEEILRVNIDVLIEGVELVELKDEQEEIIEEIKPDLIIEARKEKESYIDDTEVLEDFSENSEEEFMNINDENDLFLQTNENIQPVNLTNDNNDNISTMDSIFNNFSEKDEKYISYYVHIVRENDNIDSIATKYGVTIDELKEYNNIEQITLGNKIIIPYTTSETI